MGMTDAQLRDAAWAELEQTTIGWLKPNGQPRPSPGTHWKQAKALLDQIGQQPPPPPLDPNQAVSSSTAVVTA